MKKALVIGGVVIAAVLIGWFVLSHRTTPAELRVGVILPQTGFSAFIGESVRKGMDLAWEFAVERNPAARISLIYEDSAGDVGEAVSAYHKLRSVDRVSAVVCVSTGARALVPLADRDRVVLWNTDVSASDITAASPWSFRFFINADVDATMMGEYAVKRRGLRRLAVVYINDEMGLSYDNVFQKTVRSAGGEIVASEGFGFGVTDFKPLLLKIAAAKPDGIYIQAYNDAIGRIPVQMREMGLIIPILSVGTTHSPRS